MTTKKIALVGAIVLAALIVGYMVSQRSTDEAPPNESSASDTTRPESSATGKTLDLSGQQLTSVPDSVLI